MTKLSELSLLQRETLFATLRISITHHSNALEGTTLDYGETKTLLETQKTADNKPLDEQLKTKNEIKGFVSFLEYAQTKSLKLIDFYIYL